MRNSITQGTHQRSTGMNREEPIETLSLSCLTNDGGIRVTCARVQQSRKGERHLISKRWKRTVGNGRTKTGCRL